MKNPKRTERKRRLMKNWNGETTFEILVCLNICSLPTSIRLCGLLEEARSAGWRPVREITVVAKYQYENVTGLRDPGRRSQVTGENIFERLFTDEIVTHIATETNMRYHQLTPGSPLTITNEDIRLFVAFVISVCGERVDNVHNFLNSVDRPGITRRSYARVFKCLTFDLKTVTDLLNKSLRAVTKLCPSRKWNSDCKYFSGWRARRS
jgi:hypothetical protein